MPLKKLKIGVSACLLGMKYRYDGTDKLDRRIVERLLNKVDFVPVCPEVECGLAIPRPSMRLERGQGGTRLKVIATGEDETRRMEEWAGVKIEQLLRRGVGEFAHLDFCIGREPFYILLAPFADHPVLEFADGDDLNQHGAPRR